MSEGGFVSYYAVIPAHILHDPQLSASAKLLYGEISVRCNEKGYCWATNGALADDLKVGERTISRLVGELETAGAIRTSIESSTNRKGNRERRIFLAEVPHFGVDKIGDTANFGETGVDKNVYTLIGMNNKSRNNKSAKSAPTWMPERFERFWAWYRENVRPENRAAAVRAWDKLRPDDELLKVIGKALEVQIASELWQKGIGKPYASTYLNGRRWEDVDTSAPAAKPARRFVGTKIIDGEEIDVYE